MTPRNACTFPCSCTSGTCGFVDIGCPLCCTAP
jgi:hypothetical protein